MQVGLVSFICLDREAYIFHTPSTHFYLINVYKKEILLHTYNTLIIYLMFIFIH